MDDPISLIKALAGSYAVFAMTQCKSTLAMPPLYCTDH